MVTAKIIGPGRDQRLRLHRKPAHSGQNGARSGEGLCPEENPGDVDEEEGQDREAENRRPAGREALESALSQRSADR